MKPISCTLVLLLICLSLVACPNSQQTDSTAEVLPPTLIPEEPEPLFNGTYWFAGILALNEDFILAMTSSYRVFISYDEGRTWQPFNVDGSSRYLYVSFLDSKRGWATVNGKGLYRTQDGGRTWDFLTPTGKEGAGIVFISDDLGWMSTGERVLLSTSDGGLTWQKRTTFSSHFVPMSNFVFLNAKEGWVAGGYNAYYSPNETGPGGARPAVMPQYAVYRTDDGGSTWREQKIIPEWGSWEDQPASISFPDSQAGWIVSTKGIVVRTLDGGKSWQQQVVGSSGRFPGVQFVDRDHGWLEFFQGSDQETDLFRTDDGGESWHSVPYPAGYAVRHFCFSSAKRGLAVGKGFVLRSEDGGRTWVDLSAK